MITYILSRLSPSYRAAMLRDKIERARRIGYARHVMSKLRDHWTALELTWGDVPTYCHVRQPVPFAVRSALVRW